MSFYDHYANRSRNSFGVKIKKSFAEKLFNLAIPQKENSLKILEIGPGDGYIASLTKRHNLDYTGIEGSQIDVTNEKYHYDQINEIELNTIREKFGIGKEDKVGIFCGSLYKLKRIDFLIESVKLIKQSCSNFHFFILGNGELDQEVKNLSH